MMNSLPMYPVTVVGSWPRPQWLLEAAKRRAANLTELQDQATLLAIKYQEDAGVDVISDGEQKRDNFYSFIADRLEGMRLMTMADLLDYVEDKAAFENLLSALDVPAFAIRDPTVVGKIARRKPLVMEEYRFLRQHTRKPVKVTLPGPYLLSRCVVEGIEGPGIAIHICRGNWSQNEDVLLAGPYDSLMPYLSRMNVHQFVLEYATPRAGSPSALRLLPPHAQIGYGIVNPRIAEIESPESIVARVREVASFIAPARLYLNPDCGFGTFAERPVADPLTAFAKMRALSKAAKILRTS